MVGSFKMMSQRWTPLNSQVLVFPLGGMAHLPMAKKGLTAGQFPDGLSNTAFFSERLAGSGDENAPIDKRTMFGQGAGNGGNISPDELMDRCLNASPDSSGRNFVYAGRYEEPKQWSNGWPFAGFDASQYNHVAPPNWLGYDCGQNSYISDKTFRTCHCGRKEQP